jgi:hypothetical protein
MAASSAGAGVGKLAITASPMVFTTAPPPTAPDAGRLALYYKLAEEKTFQWVPSGCHYNDALFHADATGKVSTRAATY